MRPVLTLLIGGALAVAAGCGAAGPTATTTLPPAATAPPATAPPTTTSTTRTQANPPTTLAPWPAWATRAVARVEPGSLAPVGHPLPAGIWVEAAVADEHGVAYVTWPEEHDRWLLVATVRDGADLRVRPGGDMNVLGMFRTPDGELMVVEPIRSADGSSAAGFVVHGYRADIDTLRRLATFGDPTFSPVGMEPLEDGLLGVWGWERTRDGGFEHLRVVVYDWRAPGVVVDAVLNDVAVHPQAPVGVFVDLLRPAVVWDRAHGRALVVHAGREAITSVAYPGGEVATRDLVESRSLVEAFLLWLTPPAAAKGLSASERTAVVAGDRLHAAGSATTFADREGRVTYRTTPVGAFSVDLDSLEIVARTEAPVSVVTSVGERVLLAYGHAAHGSAAPLITVNEEAWSGLLVLDPETLETRAVHDLRVTEPMVTVGDRVYVADGPNLVVYDAGTGGLADAEDGLLIDRWLLPAGLRWIGDDH